MDPAILQQAVGRAHRMGQTRTVHVTRLIMHSTVEVTPHHCLQPCMHATPLLMLAWHWPCHCGGDLSSLVAPLHACYISADACMALAMLPLAVQK